MDEFLQLVHPLLTQTLSGGGGGSGWIGQLLASSLCGCLLTGGGWQLSADRTSSWLALIALTATVIFLLSLGYRRAAHAFRPRLPHLHPSQHLTSRRISSNNLRNLDFNCMSFGIFYTNAIFVVVSLVSTFFIFKKLDDFWNYVFSMLTASLVSSHWFSNPNKKLWL